MTIIRYLNDNFLLGIPFCSASSYNLKNNCFSSTSSSCVVGPQKSMSVCSMLYLPPPQPPPKPGLSTGLSFVSTSFSRLIRTFCYASSSYVNQASGEISWEILTSLNWGKELGPRNGKTTIPWKVKDQKTCGM